MLKMESPWAIIPVLPPKSIAFKTAAFDSPEVINRRIGLENFLKKAIENREIYTSISLKTFLTKKEKFSLLPHAVNLDFDMSFLLLLDNQTMLANHSTIKTGLNYITGMICESEDVQRKKKFGAYFEEVQKKLAQCEDKERFINEISKSYEELAINIELNIKSIDAYSENQNKTAASFELFQDFASKSENQIKLPLSENAGLQSELSKGYRTEFLEPVRDQRNIAEAAKEAFQRRRALVEHLYCLKRQVDQDSTFIGGQTSLEADKKSELQKTIERNNREIDYVRELLNQTTGKLEYQFDKFKSQKDLNL